MIATKRCISVICIAVKFGDTKKILIAIIIVVQYRQSYRLYHSNSNVMTVNLVTVFSLIKLTDALR